MGTLKKVLIGILAILILAGVVAAFLPKHFEYEFSEDMDASKETVYSIVGDLKTWGDWGPWTEMDPDMKLTFGEGTTEVGDSYTWASEKMGNGSMTITETDVPNSLKGKLVFEGQGDAKNWFTLKDNDAGGTNLAWGMSYDVPWPFNLMAAFQGGAMEELFMKGLVDIKGISEKMEKEKPKFEIAALDLANRNYVGIRHAALSHEELMQPNFFAENYGKIMEALGASNMEPAGPASAMYWEWNEEAKTTDMAVVMPVAAPIKSNKSGINNFNVQAGKAYYIDHLGSPESSGDAHYAISDYFESNGIQAGVPCIEEYIIGAEQEPDPSKWLTKIIYPVNNQVAEK